MADISNGGSGVARLKRNLGEGVDGTGRSHSKFNAAPNLVGAPYTVRGASTPVASPLTGGLRQGFQNHRALLAHALTIVY